MVKRLLPVLVLLVLLADTVGSVWPQGSVSAAGGVLVFKFPANKDFGGVSGKVLYVRQDLPSSAPPEVRIWPRGSRPGVLPAGGVCIGAVCRHPAPRVPPEMRR